jgi:hypothetical protein
LVTTRNNNNKITIEITTLKRSLKAMAIDEHISVLRKSGGADCFLENLIGS